MSPLLKLYTQALTQGDFTLPWQELVSHSLQEVELSRDGLEALVDSQLSSDLSTPQECFLFLQRLTMLSLVASEHQSVLDPLFDYAVEKPYWTASPLGQLLFTLSSKLCGREVQFSGPVAVPLVESTRGWLGGRSQRGLQGAEYALTLGVLGLLTGDVEIQKGALEHAHWVAALLDHQSFPFYSLWADERRCDLVSILATDAVLFTLCEKITKEPRWAELAERQFEHLKVQYGQGRRDLPLLPPLIDRWIGKRGGELAFCFTPRAQGCSQLITGEFESGSFACTLSGSNSGMGAIHKDRVKVVNFGPWAAPLGECGRFGVKCEGSVEMGAPLKSLKGWTRLQPCAGHPDTRLLTQVEPTLKGIDLTVSVTPQVGEGDLSFAFLIQSEEAQIGNHRFLPASMRHYVGETTTVCFYSDNEKIEISTTEKRELELIPLAGGPHFWGANFLLALSFSPNDSILKFSVS